MNLKAKIFLCITGLLFVAMHVHAQIGGDLSVTATAEIQSGGYGSVTYAPNKFKLDTKQILAFLALDEFANGNYGSTNFPAGAQLVLIGDIQFDDSSLDFQVRDQNGNELVDVSDILQLTNGINVIIWGNVEELDGTNIRSHDRKYLEKFTYDSPDPGGIGLHFSITGSATCKITQPRPAQNGSYTITSSLEMTGYGDGSFQGQPLAVTGSLGVTGRQAVQPYPIPPPPSGGGGDGGGGIIVGSGYGVIVMRPEPKPINPEPLPGTSTLLPPTPAPAP